VATQHKDLESHSSSIYSQGRLADPVIRLEEFIDGESVRNQDVVAWVSAGLYHIPAAEDAPVTPTTGNLIGFSLIPFNYGDENLATDMADMIHVEGATEGTLVDKAAARCTPSFKTIPFLKDGFEEV
jgi:Cu2+-containing amine oxidase